jgi:poly-gamma-glutamate synthesis protein (capsule biosynthesis protein)
LSPPARFLAVLIGGVLLGAASFTMWDRGGEQADPPAAQGSTTTNASGASTSDPTTTVALPTSTTEPRGTLVIHGTGDVAVDPDYIPALAANGWDYAWSGLDGLFVEDDLTVINLECVPSDIGSPLAKAFTFRCPTEALPSIRANGIEVANQANNHSNDYGTEAMLDARANLLTSDIASVGTGSDWNEATTPAMFEIDGWTVAVLGFGRKADSESWYASSDRSGMASAVDTDAMVSVIEEVATQADLVIVTVHWGVELDTVPRAEDVSRAERMIAAGADVIFGHHSHRLQPMELIDGKPVFYSLANFVWPHNSTESATTGVARVVLSADGSMEACLIPAFIETHGRPVLTAAPTCGPGIG